MNPQLKKHINKKKRFKQSAKYIKQTSSRVKAGSIKRVKSAELSNFTRQLATMVEARLPLARSLEILVEQHKGQKFQQVLQNILTQVKSGDNLADSLATHKKIFGELYISMIEVGEVAGVLELTLNRLAGHLEKMASLRKKLITAMSYPAVILSVAIGAITFLLVGIVPTFAEMFNDFGAELPAATRLVISIGDFVKDYGLYLALFLIILYFVIKKLTEREKGRYIRDGVLLKIPVIGKILKNTLISRFCRTLGTLLESGVSLLEALNVVINISGNKVFEKAVLKMKDHAIKGGLLAEPLKNSSLFPPMVTQMITVGEETAELDKMLYKVSDFYDEEIDVAIETLTAIIEPIIIVVLGVVLGGTVVAMYLQIFNLMDVIQ